MKRIFRLRLLAILMPSLLLVGGCSKNGVTTEEQLSKANFNVNLYPLNKLVCDPMDDGSPDGNSQGLKAQLFYIPPGGTQYNSVQEYIDHGVQSENTLFFSQVNVPTRLFTQGFPTETGELVKTDSGEDLIEYFALRFDSVLTLSEEDEEGLYEFALLSDDGAIWRMRKDGEPLVVVENDGDHPTKMGCGLRLEMKKGDQVDIQIDYYQGPKHHISLIPLWRKVDEDTPSDPLCGVLGNSKYFDYNNNSQPQQAYLDLLARGWKPLDKDNYKLPAEAILNPCVDGLAPVISNFKVELFVDGIYRASWTTDIPATSQVRYVDTETGAETLTEADNVLRVEHEVFLTNLFPFTTYLVQGISISESYGKAISQPVLVTPEGGLK